MTGVGPECGRPTVRQRRLTSEDDPLDLVALIDEAALRRPIGGQAVMREQYATWFAARARGVASVSRTA
jgi:Domain of unknown function (DUF5753)